MGRTASITLDDVRSARARLIADGRPHGIIAIRNKIGRGSPQLISKYLIELDGEQFSRKPRPTTSGSSVNVEQAWQRVSRSIEHFIHASDSVTANRSAPNTDTLLSDSQTEMNQDKNYRLQTLEALVTQQQASLNRIEVLNRKLEEQLMQQQDLFDSWRHEQHAERLLLKSQLDQLAQLVTKKPVKRVKNKGEQLDLYGDTKSQQ